MSDNVNFSPFKKLFEFIGNNNQSTQNNFAQIDIFDLGDIDVSKSLEYFSFDTSISDEDRQTMDVLLSALDINQDGKIDKEEWIELSKKAKDDGDEKYITEDDVNILLSLTETVGEDFHTENNAATEEKWEELSSLTPKKIVNGVSTYVFSDGTSVEVSYKGEKTICKYSNGTEIVFEGKLNDENLSIRRNETTGGIEVAGLKNADIKIPDNQSIIVNQSTVNQIKIKKSNDSDDKNDEIPEIVIKGAYTTVGKIIGNDSPQIIKVVDGAYVRKINTKGGDDQIVFENVINKYSSESYDIDTGSGNDEIYIKDSSFTVQKLSSGKGEDVIRVLNSTLNASENSSEINLGDDSDEDSFSSYNSKLNLKIDASGGNDDVVIRNSAFKKVFMSADFQEESKLTIENSQTLSNGGVQLSGNISYQINNSQLHQFNSTTSGISTSHINGSIIQGYSNNIDFISDKDTLIVENSVLQNSGYFYGNNENIVSLDTTQGEYEGYNLVTEDLSNVTVNETEDGLEYIFYNGVTIVTKVGEIYINQHVDLIFNGVQNDIISSNDAEFENKIKIINSGVSVCEVDGEVTFQNSIVDYVVMQENSIVLLKDSKANNILANGGEIVCDNGDIFFIDVKNEFNLNLNGGYVEIINGDINSIINIQTPLADSEDKLGIERTIKTIKSPKVYINQNVNEARKNITITTSTAGDNKFVLNANYADIGTIENKNNDDSLSEIYLNDSVIKNICTYNNANITLNNCVVNGEINKKRGSKRTDNFVISNSTVNKIWTTGHDTNKGFDTILIKDGSIVKELKIGGEIAVIDSTVNHLDIGDENTNLAAKRAVLNNIDRGLGANNIVIEDSAFHGEAITSYFLGINLTVDGEKIRECETIQNEVLSDNLNAIEFIKNQELEEGVEKYLNENPEANSDAIKKYLYEYIVQAINMHGETQAIQRKNLGFFSSSDEYAEYFSGLEMNAQRKAMLEKLSPEADLVELLEVYASVTGEGASVDLLESIDNQVNFASQLINGESEIKIEDLLLSLDYMSLYLDYYAYCENGPIKDFISGLNNGLGIGTTEAEIKASIARYKEQINNLKANYQAGKLTPEEFAIQYKLITGNELTQDNVKSFINNTRGDEVFDSEILKQIADYKDTTNGIFQVGEYIIILGVGIVASAVTGGFAAASVVGALSRAANMGIALTSTTASLIAKATLEGIERNHNNTNIDDYEFEDVVKDALLMYAGAMGGQLGNYVDDLLKHMSKNDLMKVFAWIVGEGTDVAVGYFSAGLLTGHWDLGSECAEELKSLLIGFTIGRYSGRISQKVAAWKMGLGSSTVNGVKVNVSETPDKSRRILTYEQDGKQVVETYKPDGQLESVVTKTRNPNGTEKIETITRTENGETKVETEIAGQKTELLISNDGKTPKAYTIINADGTIIKENYDSNGKLVNYEINGETLTIKSHNSEFKLSEIEYNGKTYHIDDAFSGKMILKCIQEAGDIETGVKIAQDYTDMLRSLNGVEQVDGTTTCKVASTLNAVVNDPLWSQAVLNNIVYIDGKYQIQIGAKSYEFEYKKGDNVLDKIYEVYCDDNSIKGLTTEFMDAMFPGCDKLVASSANSDIYGTVANILSDGRGLVTFNVGDSVNIKDIKGKSITIFGEHAYTVTSIDGNGVVTLKDTNGSEIKVSKSELEKIQDGQFAGRVVKHAGEKINDGTNERVVGGRFYETATRTIERIREENIDFIKQVDEKQKITIGGREFYATEEQKIKYNQKLAEFNAKVDVKVDPGIATQLVMTDVMLPEALAKLFGVDISDCKKQSEVFAKLSDACLYSELDFSKLKIDKQYIENYLLRDFLTDSIQGDVKMSGDKVVHELCGAIESKLNSDPIFAQEWMDYCKESEVYKQYACAFAVYKEELQKVLGKENYAYLRNADHLIFRMMQRDSIVDTILLTGAMINDIAGNNVQLPTFIDQLLVEISNIKSKPNDIRFDSSGGAFIDFMNGQLMISKDPKTGEIKIETYEYKFHESQKWSRDADYIPQAPSW